MSRKYTKIKELKPQIAELETKYHDSLAVVKYLEGRMKTNK